MQILRKAGSAHLIWKNSIEAMGEGADIRNLSLESMANTLKSWLPGIASLCTRLLLAGIILLIGLRIIHSAKKFLNQTFERMEMEISLRKFLVSLTNAMMYMLLALIVAEKLGINPTSLIAVIGSAGVAIALSLQESLSNFAGGIVILMMKPFKVGDYIITSQAEGSVINIGLIYTQLLTVDNKSVVIPNGGLANSSITNVTAENQRRLDFFVGVSYQSNLRKAKEILFQLMDTHPYTLHEEGRMPEAFVWELGESAVVLGCRAWVSTGDYWKLKFDITESVKLRYDEEGIEIPYRQVNVILKTKTEPSEYPGKSASL